MDRFDGMLEEFVFNFVLRAVNSDGAYPKVLRHMQPAHRWFGRDIPGSRWGGDSPDFVYRSIPIDHSGRYEILGWPTCDQPPSVTYTLMANMPSLRTFAILDSGQMAVEPDGAFRITVDGSPADGRPNHIQSQPGEAHLLVRDALGDWLTQSPNALRVSRLNGADRDPRSEDQLAEEAARQMLESLYYVYYCTRSGNGQSPNELRAPQSSGLFGGMATQWGAKSNIVLEADEALLVTANTAGARFRNTSLCDLFFRTLDYWSRTCTLNYSQMAADEDGRITYVVAHQDPGVHNWLDTGGLRQTIYGHRWQSFETGGPSETPTLTTHLVKLDDLERALPPGVRRIDAIGRRDQLAQRREGFARRFIDH